MAQPVSQTQMQKLYKEIKTPFKYGLVVIPSSLEKKLDCPTVFRKDGIWYMTYIIFDGRGYETWLAESKDLLDWKTKGKILSFSGPDRASTSWDAHQKAGYIALQRPEWGGSYELEPYQGKYWMSYFGGNTTGYEAGDLAIGMAYTDRDITVPHEWKRLEKPVLTSKDKDVRWWENRKIFKSTVIHDAKKLTGHEFVMYYNANGDTAKNNVKTRWFERIGMAVSDDMVNWKRFRTEPVVHHPAGITGDAVIQKIGDTYVMFYFGAFWKDRKGAFNRFAASKDLVNWTDWNGANLIESSMPYDEEYAHKSFVLKHKGIVYHFYCAVNKAGQRGIAVATSKAVGKSKLNFVPDGAKKIEAESGVVQSTKQQLSQSPKYLQSDVDFNEGWKFHLGEAKDASEYAFNDHQWRDLSLPHDWSIEGDFSPQHPAGNDGGALPGGIGWYRKTFLIPENNNQHVSIAFDGIYRNSEVWINGHYLGKRPNGYISFEYDLSRFLHKGKRTNVISVKVDNSMQPNSRWYSGSGIYRNVHLISTGDVAVDHWGTFITTPKVSANAATISMRTAIRNRGFRNVNRQLKVITELLDTSGKTASSSVQTLLLKDSLTQVEQLFAVLKPQLWSPKNPYLYTVKTRIYDGTTLLDEFQTSHGIRFFSFDSATGFSLNGDPTIILGVCMHHDLGALGAAVNVRAMERQLQMLKKMGCNAIRISHNPPAPEFLDLCDQLGFLVIDEAFDMWKKKKNKYDYSLDFEQWHRADLEDLVKRDRNHPSVIMWSIGNEIREQFDTTGTALTRELVQIVKNLDTTRPVTAALTETNYDKNYIAQAAALDVLGFNYKFEDYVKLPLQFPGQKFIATETTSALETRGVYQRSDTLRFWPASGKDKYVKNGNADYTVSAYDNTAAYWGTSHEKAWMEVKKNKFLAGLFVWTGFDYLGEPVPYAYPARSSYYGIIDLAGFSKDVYYLYQSEWTDQPVLHLQPHWNWKVGEEVDLWAYYGQADEVELFLNGKSLGTKKKTDQLHVSWKVSYLPGTLKAVSRKDGKEVLTATVKTAGAPAGIILEADRDRISSDGKDLSFVTVKVVDASGNLVPDADAKISFTIKGEGELAGLDNGFQASLESFRGDVHSAFKGKCLAIVRSTQQPGDIILSANSEGLKGGTLRISSIKLAEKKGLK